MGIRIERESDRGRQIVVRARRSAIVEPETDARAQGHGHRIEVRDAELELGDVLARAQPERGDVVHVEPGDEIRTLKRRAAIDGALSQKIRHIRVLDGFEERVTLAR